MHTSTNGIEFIERHEGVVLKAYRDVAGVWTIGAGLTRASGVVKPRPGMVITKAEASRLLGLALSQYERDVAQAMPGAIQREFDGAVSFHYNTGAIRRASWVDAWKRDDWPDVLRRLLAWRKAGGRVVRGLELRRRAEFDLIRYGDYGISRSKSLYGAPNIGLPLAPEEHSRVVADLRALGYKWTLLEVRRFQRDHDLTVDGIIGRATLSAIQRRLEAKKTPKASATAAAGSAGVFVAGDALPSWVAPVAIVGVVLLAGYFAWHYRDVIAVKVQSRAPRLARALRSF